MPDLTPFADGSTDKLRAGDVVYVVAAREEWMVLADTGTMIAWAGWPPGMISRREVRPLRRCSDDEHRQHMQAVKIGNHSLKHMILRENGGTDA